MEYYSRKNGDEKELLKDHLLKTSKLCEEFMSEFGMPVTGRVIGRLHDIGKHTKKFQEVLFGDRTKVNHAIVAGEELFPIFNKHWPDILHIIVSHHFGLSKDWNFLPDFERPLTLIDIEGKENALSNKNELKEIEEWLKSIGFNITREEARDMYLEYKKIQILDDNERMFINRMIFSCLVDADYSASASFVDSDYFDFYEGKKLNAVDLKNRLIVYRNNLIKNSKSNPELNELRNQVFNQCVGKGSSNLGNYKLTAPTGTAKTLATLGFAIENAIANNKNRIIFVLPYLSIIEQNAQIYRDICGDDVILEDDSQTIFTEKTKILSERWSAPIIITTSVKFFETLFRYKGSDLRKLHNINNSVIVFDEAQTLPNNILDSTLKVIDVLNNKFNVTTLFSTATMPSFNYRKNINWKAHEIIDNPQNLYDKYKKIKNLKVNWLLDKPYSFIDLYGLVADKESFLFIFNLKSHAGDFYKLISSMLDKNEQDSLFYISTNLCSAHRTKVLKKINSRLKRGLPTKVISTQCLEAGVDLDFQFVYRAFGPATSIIQAAGRTSRNALFPGELTVFIPEGKRVYPDNVYENAAIQLKDLIVFQKGFDIDNLEDIDKYYFRLFNTIEAKEDNLELINSIKKNDYIKVSENYKLIDNNGVTVIVPYLDKETLYSDIKNQLIENDFCINKKIMKDSQCITVTSYNKKKIETFCNKIYFRINGEKVPCNWYLLDNGLTYYDNCLGLNLDANNDFVF